MYMYTVYHVLINLNVTIQTDSHFSESQGSAVFLDISAFLRLTQLVCSLGNKNTIKALLPLLN